jgi:hypothetical protein
LKTSFATDKTGEIRMTINLVPRDIFIQHEYEWQAVREAAERRIDIGKRETPSAQSSGQTAKPAAATSAAQGC